MAAHHSQKADTIDFDGTTVSTVDGTSTIVVMFKISVAPPFSDPTTVTASASSEATFLA